MEQCILIWLTNRELQQLIPKLKSEDKTYSVTAWPLPNSKSIKLGVYVYPPREQRSH